MSLGLLLISTFSGLITAISLYFGGQLGVAASLGAYSMMGVLMTLFMAACLFFEAHNSKG